MRIRNERLRRGRILAIALLATVFLAATAQASGIDPLDGLTPPIDKTDVLTAGNGLQFTGFEFYSDFVAGTGLDPDQYEALIVSATADGLQLAGPISVEGLGEATLYLSYQVTATGAAAVGVTQTATTEVIDGGFPSFVKTSKTIFGASGGQVAFVETSNFEGVILDSESAGFAPLTTFTVLESIRISSDWESGSAEITLLDNAFSVVPEPVSGVLLGSGLLGLAVAGRRRR